MASRRFEFRIFFPGLSPVAVSADSPIMFRRCRYVRGARDVVGLFSNDMRVRDVQRYTICWPTGANAPGLRANGERSVEFRESAFCDRVPEVARRSPVGQLLRCRPRASRTVLILLESPHIHEYGCDAESGRMWPKAPAQGATGRRIEQHLADILRGGDLSRELCDGDRVIVANPVPYQASLGSIVEVPNVSVHRRREIRERLRDAVWEALWNIEAVRGGFEDRLRRYAPGVVINACTRTLGKHVAVFVAAHSPNSKQYETTHPSSWFNQKNRWLKQVLL